VEFDFEAAREAIEIVEEDVAAYFEENQDNYQFPERVKIQYIELDSAVIAEGEEVSDQEAQDYYDDNRVTMTKLVKSAKPWKLFKRGWKLVNHSLIWLARSLMMWVQLTMAVVWV